MIQLIADAGSSGTQWAAVSDKSGEVKIYEGPSINPAIQSEAQILEAMQSVARLIKEPVESIDFYGAGCNYKFEGKVSDCIREAFPDAEYIVESDVVGACRALWGDGEGFVGILGTGSVACYAYRGQVDMSVCSLGYILGDEGGGAYMGKQLLRQAIRWNLPEDICREFEKEFGLDVSEILSHVYQEPNANRYLASFTRFIGSHIDHPAIAQLVDDAFETYFVNCMNDVGGPLGAERKVGFVGSIAYHFSDILKAVAARHGYQVADIIKSPLPRLIEYHRL